MQDANELGKLIAAAVESNSPVNESLQVYEKGMIPRAKKSALESGAGTMAFFEH